MHSVEFQMSVLLFMALSGYLLASMLKQPSVVGQILAGIIIGPSVFGLITYTDFVSSLGHLGAAILLFTIGLEFKVKDLLQLRYTIISLFGVLVPWGSGFVLALLFDFEPGRASLIGVALSATSIAITADTLRELGKLDSTAARAIIGAGMVPRGEIAMVVALLTLNSGAIEQTAYIAIVLMSLLTAVFTPLVLRNWIYRNPTYQNSSD